MLKCNSITVRFYNGKYIAIFDNIFLICKQKFVEKYFFICILVIFFFS